MLIKVTEHTGGLTVTETIKKMVISNTVNLGQLWYKLKLGGGLINLLSTVYAEMYARVLHTVYILYRCSYAHTTATLLLETQTDKIKMNYSYTSADLFCATHKKKPHYS